MGHFSKATCALTSVSILALSTAAFAAEPGKSPAAPVAVDELVVTAQKRAERVQDVPLSINVVGEAQIAQQQIHNIFDLSRTAPSLELTNAPGQAVGGGGQIRGIGTVSFGVGAVGAVGIVVDGVSQGNTNIADLFDISRIEVLKGPQGTLFGLTTSAGVINITTNAPDFTHYSARIRSELSKEGSFGSTAYGQQVIQGAVNIPMGENAGLRLSANYNGREGPGRNALDGTLDERETINGRARFLWRPTDRFTLNVNGDYNRNKGDGPDFFTVYKADPALTAQLANCRLFAGSTPTPVVPSNGNRDYCSTNTVVDGARNVGGSITADYAFDNFTLTSITAARRNSGLSQTSLDIFRLRNAYFTNPIPVPPFVSNSGFVGAPSDIVQYGAAVPPTSTLVTQEVRIASPTGARFEYTAGLFYSNQTTETFGGNSTALRAFTGPGAAGPFVNGIPAVGTPSTDADHSAAVFGQATWHVTDQLGLIGGLRYTKETLKQNTITTAGVQTHSRSEINNTSWRVGAQYKVDPSLQVYATISKGYKGAQFAVPICPVSAAAPSGVCPPGTPSRIVLPELPTDYELGGKKVLFDGRAILDLSAFYIEMTNYQGQQCVTNSANTLTCTIQNFGGVISKGVEANLLGRVSDDFTVNTGLIWNPATYPSPFRGGDGTNIGGAQLKNAPVWKFTFSGEYSHEVASGLQAFVSGDAVYKTAIRYSDSTNPLLSYPANWVVGGRAGVRSETGAWSVSAFVQNATDEHIPVLRQAGFPYGENYGQFLSTGSFRVVGLSLEAGF